MGRVAVVTGGSRGIGAAISKALKAAGYKVAEPNLTRYDLFNADECFLTGTGAEMVPDQSAVVPETF